MTTVHESLAADAINEAAPDAACGLGLEAADRPGTFAIMVAALAYEGWTGRAADDVLAVAMEGCSTAELAAAKRGAASIKAPWSAWADASMESKDAAVVLRRLLRHHLPTAAMTPDPGGIRFDLEAPPAAPRWVVRDFLVRGKTHMLSGPTHALKTGLREAMMAASLTGGPFLGRDVPALKWMILDGENSSDDLAARWKALGITDDHWPSIHLTTREKNVRLGEEHWDAWLAREVEMFQPDVLVIDTIARCCAGIDSNSADAVADLYARVLVPLVDRHDLALLFSAHHRKSGGRAGTDDAVNGSVQWSGQAEQTITVATTGPLTFEPQSDGTTNTRRTFALRRPKGRTLVSNAPEHFEVRGRLGADDALLAFEVVQPASEPSTVERLIAALDSPLGTGVLARAVGLNRTGDKFRKALTEATDAGLIVKTDDGLYERDS